MAPALSRQILVWSLAPVALLFSYLWYKRKKSSVPTDRGGTTNGYKKLESDSISKKEEPIEQGQGDAGLNFFSETVQGDSVQHSNSRKRKLSDSAQRRLEEVTSTPEPVCATTEIESEFSESIPEDTVVKTAVESATGAPVDQDTNFISSSVKDSDAAPDNTIREGIVERISPEHNAADNCSAENIDNQQVQSTVDEALVKVPTNTSTKAVNTTKRVNICDCKGEILTSSNPVKLHVYVELDCDSSSCDEIVSSVEDGSLARSKEKSDNESEAFDSCTSSTVTKVSTQSGLSEKSLSRSSSVELKDSVPEDTVKSENRIDTTSVIVTESSFETPAVCDSTVYRKRQNSEESSCSKTYEYSCQDLTFGTNIGESADSGSTVQSCQGVEEEGVSSTSAFQCQPSFSSMARKSTRNIESEPQGAQDPESELQPRAGESSESERWLEEKFAAIELGNSVPTSKQFDPSTNCEKDSRSRENEQPHSSHQSERDSANHSPSEAMLASPSMSNYSDEHSEGSCDSGKGGSDVTTPAGSVDVELGFESPSQTPGSGTSLSGDIPSVFEFLIPQHLVGRLIGRHGAYVNLIKTKTRASIFIKRHPETTTLKICAVEGTQMEIDNALAMIRQKFPLKKYPSVTLEQVCFVSVAPSVAVIPESLQLHLAEGVSNDVILSSLVSAGHFFLQQPTHPTYPELARLDVFMALCYNEPSAPGIPPPVEAGVICASPTMGGWYRAQVMSVDQENETCEVKYVDYGGYQTQPTSELRQIRSDFMTLPFQAAECYLSHVKPVSDYETWPAEAVQLVEALTQGRVLQAQVTGYAEDGVPTVHLYATHGAIIVWVNQELVQRGLAEWMEEVDE